MENVPENENTGADRNMDVFMDLQLAASIRFGETEMLIEDVIKLGVATGDL